MWNYAVTKKKGVEEVKKKKTSKMCCLVTCFG